jgi:NAD-dependent SIR2 family protein deacetylase
MSDRYVGYSTAHIHVRQERGSASEYKCRHCGRQAQDWAYNHRDPNEAKESAYGPFSRDIKYYMPLCCSCHQIFDRAVATTKRYEMDSS